jgi:peptide/nickel transport system substrate-binding protein
MHHAVSRRTVLALALRGGVGLAGLGLATGPGAAAEVKRGGELRSAWYWTWPSMDPHLSNVGFGYDYSLLYDMLVRYDLVDEKMGRFEVRPELAESWDRPDNRTFILKLRRGVRFHDGSEFNAEVAKFNLDRLREHPKSFGKEPLAAVDRVDAVDRHTIRIVTKHPAPSLLVGLSRWTMFMVSKAQLEKLGDVGFAAQPSGTGPMQFVEHKKDDRVVFKRWDGHWQKGADGKPLPYIDRYVNRFIADPTVAVAEMRAGSLDLITQVDAKDVAIVRSNPNLVYWANPHFGRIYMTTALSQYKGPFSNNPKLRQAALYAIDRDAMAKTLALGIGRAHYYPQWNDGMIGYDPTLPRYDYQPERAKTLLREAGLPGGTDVTVSVISRPADLRAGEMLKSMWDAVGIRTTLEVLERLAWIDKVKAKNYEVCFWGGSPSPDPDLVRTFLQTGAPANWGSYSNKDVDRLFEEAGATYDVKKREELYRQIQRILFEDAHIATGYYLPWNFVHQKHVRGLVPQFSELNLKEVWLDK